MSFLEFKLRNIKTTGPLAKTVKTKVILEGVIGPKWDPINTKVALAWMMLIREKTTESAFTKKGKLLVQVNGKYGVR